MLNEQQYRVAKTAIDLCLTKEGPYEVEFIEKKVMAASGLFDYEDDTSIIIRYVESKVNCSMQLGISVVSEEAEHSQDWIQSINNENKIYATSYERYLRQKGMSPSVVNAISRVNDSILSLLGDPRQSNYLFQRRGLVIGDVQSGKTSNYLSLVTKAADAGYKFIIIIAGIHNNLRSQTQQRVDEGFVGRVSIQGSSKAQVGVSLEFNGEFPHPVSFTTADYDFNKKQADTIRSEISDFNKPVVLVIKKNVSTLRSLYEWLVSFNMNGAKANGRINVPMLMIDDESDNASINTNNPDLDPTKTNYYLRTILKSFNQASYVGYTATPFANIFIDPQSYDSDTEEDLFPKDFIYNLDAPSNYFGASKIFLDETYKYVHIPLLRDEVGKHIKVKHKKDFDIKSIPNSLKEAIRTFLLSKCVRNLRHDAKEHCSMLINMSIFVDVQKRLKNKVLDYLDELGNEILSFSAMPNALDYEHISLLHQTFNKHYKRAVDLNEKQISWDQIIEQLRQIFDSSKKEYVFKKCIVVNSNSEEALDYSEYNNQGLMVIAIGGFSLSRGLTIEGLTVSYFYRSTQMYDTLLQMGRWFGYRPQYEDLCRIYMTDEAYSWYQHITKAAEDVRRQIAIMNQLKKTPKDFGLYVRASDEGLLITARNKMKSAQGSYLNRSFSGKLQEQVTFSCTPTIHASNYQVIEFFWHKLNGYYQKNILKTGVFFKNVEAIDVIELLSGYQFSDGTNILLNQETMEAAIRYFLAIQYKYPQIDVIFRSKYEKNSEVIDFKDLKAAARNNVSSDGKNYKLNRHRLGSDADEKIGLSEQQLKNLIKQNAESYRRARQKPLLIIYFVDLSLSEEDSDTEIKVSWQKEEDLGFPAISLSFPFGDEEKQVPIYGNRIYVENTMSNMQDDY